MDIRSIQRTGSMFYVYLPTSWCKTWNIRSGTKVQLNVTPEGKLLVSPALQEEKQKHLEISVDEDDLRIINKLIVALYINPASSFKIHLKEKLDQAKLLDQKLLVPIELVEVEGKTISCESSISVSDPHLLLKTILNKIKNMIIVMTNNYNSELIMKYEEEIDRNRLLIEKSVVSALVHNHPHHAKTINLYYISIIAKQLESIADLLIRVDRKERAFLEDVLEKIGQLKDILGDMAEKNVEAKTAITFCREVFAAKDLDVASVKQYHKQRIKECFVSISETLIDLAITNEMGK